MKWQNLVGEEKSHLLGVKIDQEYIVEVENLLNLRSLAVAWILRCWIAYLHEDFVNEKPCYIVVELDQTEYVLACLDL